MEEEASAMSGLRRPNNGLQIVFGGFDSKDTLHRPIIEWYAINIEVPDPEEAETYPSSEKLSTNKLIPFFAGELNKSSFFEAIGPHLYCVGTVDVYDPNSVNDRFLLLHQSIILIKGLHLMMAIMIVVLKLHSTHTMSLLFVGQHLSLLCASYVVGQIGSL